MSHRHFSSILLNVLKPSVIDFAEFWAFLFELYVEERVLFGEIERVVGFVRNISWLFGCVIVMELRGVFLVVIVMIVVLMVIVMALLSH